MKLIIYGNSGSGKSTLARRLADEHGLAFLELDTVAWIKMMNPPRRLSLADSMAAIHAFDAGHDRWVVEGAYGDLVDAALPLATELVFLNPGVATCIENARKRPWEPHKFDSADEQDAFLPSLLDWIGQYETRTDEYALSLHRRIFETFPGKKTEITDLADLAGF